MVQQTAELPDDVESLKRLVVEQRAERDLAFAALKIQTLEVRPLLGEAGSRGSPAGADGYAGFNELCRTGGLTELAVAIRYALSRWAELTRYRDDGRLEISAQCRRHCRDNNAAERAMRAIALGRKNWLFAGSDHGGERAAAIYTLIKTAKLNGLDPEAYLRDVLARIAAHPARQIDGLLPWAWAASHPAALAA